MANARLLPPKPEIIRELFEQRVVAGRIPTGQTMVMRGDVRDAILSSNARGDREELSTGNLANFFKDIVRYETRNRVFPPAVFAAGYTAVQRTGDGAIFEFVPVPRGWRTPFRVHAPPTHLLRDIHEVQTLTLVASGRRYGRKDESWLTAVATAIGLVQTHLALDNRHNLMGMALVAPHIKLRRAEIDALYHAEDANGSPFVIACEVKGESEVLDEDQIDRAARAVIAAPATGEATVVPVAIKKVWYGSLPPAHRHRRDLIWICEYAPTFPLRVVNQRLYRLTPSVQGI